MELFSVNTVWLLVTSAGCDDWDGGSIARALPLALVKREADIPLEGIASPGTTLCVPSWDWVEELWPCNPVVEGSIAATSAQMSSKSGAGRGVISSSIHVPSSMWPQRKPDGGDEDYVHPRTCYCHPKLEYPSSEHGLFVHINDAYKK
jgi:hypothetical protein